MEHPIVFLPILIGAFALFAGFNQMLHFLMNREQKEELYFVAFCLFYFLYNLCSALFYRTPDPTEAVMLARARYGLAIAALGTLFLFTYHFFRIRKPWLWRTILLSLAGILFLLIPGGFAPASSEGHLILGKLIREPTRLPFMNLPLALDFGLLLTLCWLVYGEWRRARKRRVLVFLSAYLLLAMSMANDVLFLAPMYTSEYGILPLLIAMSYSMADRSKQMFVAQERTSRLVIETHQEFQKKLRGYADELEHKVNVRTKELRDANQKSKEALMEIDKLNEFSREITSTTRMNEVVDRILNYITNNFGITSFWLVQIDEEAHEFYTGRISDFLSIIPEGSIRELNRFRAPFGPEAGMLWQAARDRRPLVVTEIDPLRLTDADRAVSKLLNLKGLLLVPLIIQSKIYGVACFGNYEGDLHLTDEDVTRITHFCDQIAGAIYSASLIQQIEQEREESDRLLRNILPDRIAHELKERGEVKPVYFESVSVLFSDLVGFTRISSQKGPGEIIDDLNGLFHHFDGIAEHNGLEKIKTIGDAYMAAGGLPERNNTHAVDMCLAALEIINFAETLRKMHGDMGEDYYEMRVGIHTGPVMAGVVGKNKFAYDIFGDSVNVASRMESGSEPGRINISEDTYKIVSPFFDCEYRGELTVKNRGRLHEYFLNRIRPELSRDDSGLVPNEKFRDMYEALKYGETVINTGERGLVVREIPRDEILVLELRGEINLANARVLADRLRALLNANKINVIIDLGQVDFIDSTGIGSLMDIHRLFLEREGRLAVINIPKKIETIFRGLGIQLHDSVPEALEEMQSHLRRKEYPEDLDFNINFMMRGRAVILRLAGKLNFESSRILRERLEALSTEHVGLVILNLEQVKSIDSSGFGVILFGHNRFSDQGGALRIVNVPPRQMELFQFSRLEAILSILPDEETALSAVPDEYQTRKPSHI